MKRCLSFFLVACLLLTFSSCAENATAQDTSPLTMYIGLGATSGSYYTDLQKLIFEKTGIEVQYVFSNTDDTSNAMLNRIENNDLPTDIMITASATDPALQKSAFLDLSKYSNITDLFTISTIQSYSVGESVYQLPFTSRLIGIEYNKTLFEEMGWNLPSTFAEMVALKEKADKAGIPFAVTGNYATGHGFNYLFHLLGTQFLNTPDGNEWLDNFQSGTANITELANEIPYFQKYAEAGLFGSIYTADWNASTAYCRTRALFYYNILNDVYSYDGFRYTEDGKLAGAQYNADGTVVTVPAADGIAVCDNGTYVLYDADNEAHQSLERVDIPGAEVLHDTYGSMPWISENGSSNYFTVYNNIYISLDKQLGEACCNEKLQKAIQVLETMTTPEATALYSKSFRDGYIAVRDFTIDDTAIYSDFSQAVSSGYLMEWYYNRFDVDSIVFVGELVNSFLRGDKSVTTQTILNELTLRNENQLNGTTAVLAEMDETLEYKDSAKLLCIANGLSLQSALTEAGNDSVVDASVLPYTENLTSLPLQRVPVVQEKFYKGGCEESKIRAYIVGELSTPTAITMNGSELKKLLQDGFTFTDANNKNYHFSYCIAWNSGEPTVEDEKTYVVALPEKCLSATQFETFNQAGNVAKKDGTVIVGNMEQGLRTYAATHPHISADTLSWTKT